MVSAIHRAGRQCATSLARGRRRFVQNAGRRAADPRCSPYTITDEIRRTETGMREKILRLQRIEYDEDQRVQILLGYCIMGKKPSKQGDTPRNYRVRESAHIVGEVFPGCRVSFGASGQENRSYRVPFEKIRKHLPGFRCAWDARRGAKQLYNLFKRIDMTKKVFEYRTFMSLKQLEYLIRTQQTDPQFFWTNEDGRSTG